MQGHKLIKWQNGRSVYDTNRSNWQRSSEIIRHSARVYFPNLHSNIWWFMQILANMYTWSSHILYVFGPWNDNISCNNSSWELVTSWGLFVSHAMRLMHVHKIFQFICLIFTFIYVNLQICPFHLPETLFVCFFFVFSTLTHAFFDMC